jgi:alpha-tubulin suppressor-like RCC1 family protein
VPSSDKAVNKVEAIDSYHNHTCAIGDGGGVWCWGRNAYGQLGDDSVVNRSTPVAPAVATSQLIAAGRYHSCSATDNTVWCWGRNDYGQLGDGTVSPMRGVPAATTFGCPAVP